MGYEKVENSLLSIPIIQYVLGLYHASVNWISIEHLMQRTPQNVL